MEKTEISTEISNAELLEILLQKIDLKFLELSKSFKEHNEILASKLDKTKQQVGKLREENRELKRRIEILENTARRNRVAIFGIHFDRNNLLDSVLTELNRLLKTEIRKSDVSNIYHPQNNPRAPVIVEFLSNLKKAEVLGGIKPNIEDLKKAKVIVTNDLSKSEREIVKFLRIKRDEAKARNQVAKIVGRNLIIDGQKFYYKSLETGPDASSEFDTDRSRSESDEAEDDTGLNAAEKLTKGTITSDKSQKKKRKSTKTPSPRYRTTRSAKKKKY